MPEGPELYRASVFISNVCKGKIFGGQVETSAITKCPGVEWNKPSYTISASSRGKEIKLKLTEVVESENGKPTTKQKLAENQTVASNLDILVRFGLVGKFKFSKVEDIEKHAHLNFFTKDKKMVLSFVDYMRFGKWEPNGDWGRDRGPCVLFEYDKFRENVLSNLQHSVFNKPLCEALLDQRFFNGIGNYLRAEIIHRAGVPPFVRARDALESLNADTKMKTEMPDILMLCHQLPKEVINLSEKSSYYDSEEGEDPDSFSAWLQCYYKPHMKNLSDHNRRTIWFSGEAGPLKPQEDKVRKTKTKKHAKAPSKKAFEETVEVSLKKRKLDTKQLEATKKKVDQQVSEDLASSIVWSSAHDWVSSPRKTRSRTKRLEKASQNLDESDMKSKAKKKSTTPSKTSKKTGNSKKGKFYINFRQFINSGQN